MSKAATQLDDFKAAFIDFLVLSSSVSQTYADAAWFTLSHDNITSLLAAKKAAYSYAKRYIGVMINPTRTLSMVDKEQIARKALLIGLNDLPQYVVEQETLKDFIDALNEHSAECELVRCDKEDLAFLGQWQDVSLNEVPALLI